MRTIAGIGILLVTAACTPGTTATASGQARTSFVQANLAGGWADGAEAAGSDDVVVALVEAIDARAESITALFLNEACESHAHDVAARLGPEWRAFFVRAWDGESGCFPAPGATEGRFGNAVVTGASAVPFVVPSCNDVGADPARCLPNWAPPAEQRRAVCVTTSEDDALCSVHLDPKAWAPHVEQLHALGRIARDLAGEHRRVVIGADLNDGADEAEAAFGAHFTAVTTDTHPSRRPRRAIDHIVIGGDVRDARARALDLGRCVATLRDDGRCSDHHALLATVVLG